MMKDLSCLDFMHLGEILSKCDHIATVPLKPETADKLHRIYLAKGIHATTQIEGNTLSEEEVRRRVEGDLPLPDSQEYLGTEIDNVLAACQLIAHDLALESDMRLRTDRITAFNGIVLRGLPVEPGVAPGAIRTDSVLVGNVYRGAPAEDCEFLLDELCRWLEAMNEHAGAEWRRPVRVIGAILAHLYLAWIHPFGDGNGRTARLVEFQLLADAGFPTPACHLLSNYYNRTRQLYYRVLRETSRAEPFPVERFVSYALKGLAEELREQLKTIEAQQLRDAWVSFVHEVDLGGAAETAKRRRLLALSLPPEKITPVAQIRRLDPDLAAMYATKQQKTITRDINQLEEAGIVRHTRSGVRPAVEQLLSFLPIRKES